MTGNAFHYCAGCGHSITHRLIAEVIDEMDIRGITIGVPPAGCAVLAYNYFNVDMIEAQHGRGPATATGIKRVLPDRVVSVGQTQLVPYTADYYFYRADQ